jgi:predicted HAD superfamily Cof-like phosphohydrolase
MTKIEQVEQFMLFSGQKVSQSPNTGNVELQELRVELLREELKELQEALLVNDLIEVADALVDLEYVLLGAILSFGLKDKFDILFQVVHDNNMTKFCKSHQEAIDTVEYYAKRKNTSTYVHQINSDLFVVKRTSDNKVLKSIEYQPVNLKQILEDGYNTAITESLK